MRNYNYKCIVSNTGKRYYKNVGGKWKRISNKLGMKAEKGKMKYGMDEELVRAIQASLKSYEDARRANAEAADA